MNYREAHKIWIAQCEAAETVQSSFWPQGGLQLYHWRRTNPLVPVPGR